MFWVVQYTDSENKVLGNAVTSYWDSVEIYWVLSKRYWVREMDKKHVLGDSVQRY